MTIENKTKDLVSYETSEEMLSTKDSLLLSTKNAREIVESCKISDIEDFDATIKIHNLIVYVKHIKNQLPKYFVYINDLKSHPLNEKLYPRKKHKKDIENLKKALKEHEKKNGWPNHTPIVVCPKTSIIFSGHFRVLAAKKMGVKYLYVDISPKFYDPNESEYEQLEYLQQWNLDGKRDEANKVTAVRQFLIFSKAHYDKTGKEFPPEEKRKFWKVRSIDRADGRNYVKIGKTREDLLQEIQDNKISLAKALKLFNDGNIKKLPINPKRYDFFKFIEQHKNWRKNLLKRFIISKDHHLKETYEKQRLLYHPKYGWEPNQISAVFSNILMSSTAIAFTEEGLDAYTPISNQGAADNRFPGISMPPDKFDEERMEMKFASWGGSVAKTWIWAGLGANAQNPHEFLIGIHNQECNRLFLVLTTITSADWKSYKKNSRFNMQEWFKRHEHEKDFKVLVGSIYRGNNKKICIDFQSTDKLLKEVL